MDLLYILFIIVLELKPFGNISTNHMEQNLLSTNRLLKKTVQTIHEYQMIPPHTAILAGISGGPDSICLLHVLMTLSQRFRCRIGIAHLNHGLRSTVSDQDAVFVRSLAEKQNIPFFYKRTDIQKKTKTSKKSIEETGRNERYTFFSKVAASHGFDKIALGHHRDDNAELVLMNLLRGSGPLGLSGIPPIRNNIIRPLIGVSRSEIMSYLTENDLKYLTDYSNADTAFLRNKIRHELLPLLKEQYNPNIGETLNRLSDIFRREEDWLNILVGETLDQITKSRGKNELVLFVSGLQKLHTAHLSRILRAGVKQIKGNLRRIRLSQIDAAIEMIYSNQPHSGVDLPDRIRLEKINDSLIIRQESKSLRSIKPLQNPPVYHYTIHLEDLPVELWMPEIRKTLFISRVNGNSLPDLPQTAQTVDFLDFDRIRFPLIVRNPEAGDRFIPFGMKNSQKIKDYFINNKVPKQDRSFYPVVVSRHQIIWLAGQRIADAAKVTPSSQRFIKAELKTGENEAINDIKQNTW